MRPVPYISACAEHGAPVGRSPPRSTTRKRKVRREGGRKRSRLGEFLRPGLRARPFFRRWQAQIMWPWSQFDLCEKKTSQIARSSRPSTLTGPSHRPSVRDAPSTERPRLMALRSAVASAAVSRKAGRRRHRLGAFRCGPSSDGRQSDAVAGPRTRSRTFRTTVRRQHWEVANCGEFRRSGA